MDVLKKNRDYLDPDVFYTYLSELTSGQHFLVAYSGGLDSHVLLHLLSRVKRHYPQIMLRSVYIDHGLQDVSADWAIHCKAIANALAIPHETITLNLKIKKGESVEAAARNARYKALREHVLQDEVLLTAQHQDDQAETLLLQLLRGAGLDGLASMPLSCSFAKGYHIRPLLLVSRQSLEEYAATHSLSHITDPTNAEIRFDRNYLRHRVIPSIKSRWPEMAKLLSRSARFQAEASELLSDYLDKDLVRYQGVNKQVLSVSALKNTPKNKQKALLRQWIKNRGFSVPSEVKLEHIMGDVLFAAKDASPIVEWQNNEVRRYKDDLYTMPSIVQPDSGFSVNWDLTHSVDLGYGIEPLQPEILGDLKGILLQKNIPVIVRFRQGGEQIRPQNRKCSISLKNLLQEKSIPPWQRQRLPLIYVKEQLIQVVGLAHIDPNTLQL